MNKVTVKGVNSTAKWYRVGRPVCCSSPRPVPFFLLVPLPLPVPSSVFLREPNPLLALLQGRFQTVVAFKPTGWSMQRGKGRIAAGRRQQNGTVVTYQVPHPSSQIRGQESWAGRPSPCVASSSLSTQGPSVSAWPPRHFDLQPPRQSN